jgi:hypothetical protein
MDQRPHPQATVGGSEDSLLVYQGQTQGQMQGQTEAPLDAVPAWRYEEKNGLKPHTVPAVDEFRKAVEVAENEEKQP